MRLELMARAALRILSATGAALAGLGGAALIFMMLLGTADVAGTNLLNRPVPATFEATETLLVITVFAPLAYLQGKRRHIAADLLVSRFPPRLRVASEILSSLVGFALFALITWQGGMWAWKSWQVREVIQGLINFPVYPAKIILVVASGLFALRAVADLAGGIYNLFRALRTSPGAGGGGP